MFLLVASIIICAVHLSKGINTPPSNTPTIPTPVNNTPEIFPTPSNETVPTEDPTSPATSQPTKEPTKSPTDTPNITPTVDPCSIEHKFSDWTVTKNATCNSEGIKTRYCTICGKIETQNIPQLEHKYTLTRSLIATIDKRSETTYKCEHCGKAYTTYGDFLRPEIGKGYTCGDNLIGHGLEHS